MLIISPSGGRISFSEPIVLEFSSDKICRYTFDGTPPILSSNLYMDPIYLDDTLQGQVTFRATLFSSETSRIPLETMSAIFFVCSSPLISLFSSCNPSSCGQEVSFHTIVTSESIIQDDVIFCIDDNESDPIPLIHCNATLSCKLNSGRHLVSVKYRDIQTSIVQNVEYPPQQSTCIPYSGYYWGPYKSWNGFLPPGAGLLGPCANWNYYGLNPCIPF